MATVTRLGANAPSDPAVAAASAPKKPRRFVDKMRSRSACASRRPQRREPTICAPRALMYGHVRSEFLRRGLDRGAAKLGGATLTGASLREAFAAEREDAPVRATAPSDSTAWPTSGRANSNSRRRPTRVARRSPPSVSLARWALAACGDKPATIASSPAEWRNPSRSTVSIATRDGSARSAPTSARGYFPNMTRSVLQYAVFGCPFICFGLERDKVNIGHRSSSGKRTRNSLLDSEGNRR